MFVLPEPAIDDDLSLLCRGESHGVKHLVTKSRGRARHPTERPERGQCDHDGPEGRDAAEFLVSFVDKLKDRIEAVSDAVAAKGFEEVRYLAHSVKGFCKSVGMGQMGKIMFDVEDVILAPPRTSRPWSSNLRRKPAKNCLMHRHGLVIV